MKRPTVAIVGGGAAGTLVALHLLRQEKAEHLNILLLEREGRIGQGIAYSAENTYHLLNVPANRMGAFYTEHDHFYRWLQAEGLSVEPTDFVPRRWYGEYLNHTLWATNTQVGGSLTTLQAEIADVLPESDGSFRLLTTDGRSIDADYVVLALGNLPPANLHLEQNDYLTHLHYHANPWTQNLMDNIGQDDSVFILGTGLTMVDTLISLQRREHRGSIIALSRNCYLPFIHAAAKPYPDYFAEIGQGADLHQVLKTVHRHLALAPQQGSNWRAVIDALRPYNSRLWRGFSLADKQRFISLLAPLWSVARHRIPLSCAEVIYDLQERGQLTLEAGRVQAIAVEEDEFSLSIRKGNLIHHRRAKHIINCMGPQTNFEKTEEPLIVQLAKRGILRRDNIGLGIEATDKLRVVDQNGQPQARIYALGSCLRGLFWESTAINEIREQAFFIAQHLNSCLGLGYTAEPSGLEGLPSYWQAPTYGDC